MIDLESLDPREAIARTQVLELRWSMDLDEKN